MISLAIISRKEDQEDLRKAVNSCISYVDEVIIADTSKEGGIDQDFMDMKNVSWSKTQIVHLESSKIKITPFAWTGDFSAARNFSFEQCTGDIIFWIDSDDTVDNPELLPRLAQEITDNKVDWIYSRYNYEFDEQGNCIATHWKPRLFRKGTVKWQKSVHEDATPTTGVIQAKDSEMGKGELIITHHTKEGHNKASQERNLAILMAEYEQDKEQTDPRTIQYLAITLEGMERYKEAVPFFVKHIETTGSQHDKFWSLHRLSSCLWHLGDSRAAVSVCMDALKLFPEWQTAYFDLAAIYYNIGEWAKVIEWTLTGQEKQVPEVLDVINPQDYDLLPYIRLCEAFLYLGKSQFAYDAASLLTRKYPDNILVKECLEAAKEAARTENYVSSFLKVAGEFRKYDRIKAAKLFDLLPQELEEDARIQEARKIIVPPTFWNEKSVVIYCGDSLEEWAYPSIFTGIGGSEEAVINISQELVKLGYEVTVYNRCGKYKGIYNGVEYKPFFFFNPEDTFNVLISWRLPGLFLENLAAKKKYLWLHDILHKEAINETIIKNVDKILFLSKWHSQNVPGIPEDKIFITNNGINPEDFAGEIVKKPNSLIWSSSYDRGLLPFIKNILPLIKQEIPEVTLDVAYGWQNITKEMNDLPHLKALYDELSPILEHTPGITHHGRLPHRKLAELMKSSMAYPYASEFGETNNITSQKCQAAGCYVITTSQAGGTPERVLFGKVIEGNGIYTNQELQQQFSQAVIDYLNNPTASTIGTGKVFAWETTAKQWQKELL